MRMLGIQKGTKTCFILLLMVILLTIREGGVVLEKEGFELIVCPCTRDNPRNTEAAIVALKDGRLLLAYSEFYAGGSEDDAPCRISGKVSRDGGRSWGDKFVLQENVGKQNVMSVSLLRLKSGELAMFYLVKNSDKDLKVYLKKSWDEGKSWGEAICVTPEAGYHVMNNDRVIQLKSGRLLAPVSYTGRVWSPEEHYKALCFYSDDNGKTWKKGKTAVDLPKRGAMEPGLVELKDGRVFMILRTQLGRIYKSYSEDGGISWSEPEPMELVSPEAPATIKRIPPTGDLLIVWNNNFEPGADHCGRRTPLTSAISKDEGKTWQKFKNLESDPNCSYAYTSVTFLGKRALLTYWVGRGGFLELKLRSLPIKWFYE